MANRPAWALLASVLALPAYGFIFVKTRQDWHRLGREWQRLFKAATSASAVALAALAVMALLALAIAVAVAAAILFAMVTAASEL